MDDKTTEILKCAILMEKRGQAFYTKVAQQASGEVVKRFFEMMAEEEKNHIKILSEQYGRSVQIGYLQSDTVKAHQI